MGFKGNPLNKRSRSFFVSIVYALFFSAAYSLSVYADTNINPSKDIPATIAQNEILKKSLTETQQPACPDDKIIIEIKDIHISVRRYLALVTLSTGEQRDDLANQCNLKFIKNAIGVGRIGFGIQDYSKNPTFSTTYESYKQEIEKAQKEGKIEQLSDGVQRVPFGASEFYILPLDKATTANNQPIVFECDGHETKRASLYVAFCSTGYILPGGFIFGYKLDRTLPYNTPDHFLEIDHNERKDLKSLINEAKNIESKN